MPNKRDQAIETIFGQLELLSEMAVTVGDRDLAGDLKVLLEKALSRYCDRKREELGIALTSVSLMDVKQALKA